MPLKIDTYDEPDNDLPPRPVYACEGCGEEFLDYIEAQECEEDCRIVWGEL